MHNNCWVEAGYSTYGSNVQYYWADQRPDAHGGNYNEHPITSVPSGDYGNYTWFDIHRTSGNSFLATISDSSYYWTGSSTYNSMTPNQVNMGQELAGNGGASAADAYYIYMYYYDTNNNQTQMDTGTGNRINQSPPYVGGSGGSFYTHCC
jgi:PKD repeat protein